MYSWNTGEYGVKGMAVYGHSDWRTRGSRVSASSLILLAIFVAAAVLMLAIVLVQPGLKGDAGGLTSVQPEAGAPAEAQMEAVPAEAAAPVVDAVAPAEPQPVENAGP